MRRTVRVGKKTVMESDSEKEVQGPPSKRPKLELDQNRDETPPMARKEQDDSGDHDGIDAAKQSNNNSDDESDDHQGGPLERESVVSGDEFSELSNMSGLDDGADEAAWLPVAGPIAWVQRQMQKGIDPRMILRLYLGDDYDSFDFSDGMNGVKLWELVVSLMMETTALQRSKLTHVNTLEDVVSLLKNCHNIIVLTGAGVSVSCGIPDFRSENGIYARLAKDFPKLPNPQSMFDITFFKSDQRPFFKFAKEIYPGQFEPSPCHKFIRLLETQGKLLRNYTQNIDTLEKVAGVERAIECHGSFATATCMVCKFKVDKEAVREDIFNQVIPRCPRCGPDVEGAVMKPDIVFFGESLPEEFHRQMRSDKDVCDLLIVIGSSLKVRPVSRIPCSLPSNVPQIIINREPLTKQYTFDVELLGNCDDIVAELCKRLGNGWESLARSGPQVEQIGLEDLPPKACEEAAPEDVKEQEAMEAVVEHNADSGLGDLEAGASAFTADNTQTAGPAHRPARSDRLVRLSSSDSGAESSVVDTHTHSAQEAEASSKHNSEPTSKQDTAAASKLNTEPTSKQDTAAASKLNTEPTSKQDTAAASKLNTEPTCKQDTAAASKLSTEPTCKQDTAAASKRNTEPTCKQDTAAASKLNTEPTCKQDTAAASELNTEPTSKLDAAAASVHNIEPASKQDIAAASKQEAETVSKVQCEVSRFQSAPPAADLVSTIVEVSAYKDPDSLTSLCPAKENSHGAESGPSQTQGSSQQDSEAAYTWPCSSKFQGSLSTCQGPIERKAHNHHHNHHHKHHHHHHKASSSSQENDAEDSHHDHHQKDHHHHKAPSSSQEGDGEKSEELSKDSSPSSPVSRPLVRQRKKRQSIASRCKENQIVFIPPSRYIFPGAEVYSDDDDDSSSDDDSPLSFSPIPEGMINEDNHEEGSQNGMNSLPSLSEDDDPDAEPYCYHYPIVRETQDSPDSPDPSPPSSPFMARDIPDHPESPTPENDHQLDQAKEDAVSKAHTGQECRESAEKLE